MWNIFLGGLLTGATLILYDGSPFYPSPERHLKSIISLGYDALSRVVNNSLMNSNRATVFGGSPRYFAELMKQDVIPSELLL